MSELHVPCPTCGGSGQVPFARQYPRHARTCRLLYGCPPQSATDLHRAAVTPYEPIGITAWSQRLEDLRALGFVEREKRGRQWLYSLTEAGQEVARQSP